MMQSNGETNGMRDEGVDRKNRTIKRLYKLGIPFLPRLPTIEMSKDARLPSAIEVARRAMAALSAAAKAETCDAEIGRIVVDKFSCKEWLTPGELEFLELEGEEGDRATFSWRYESIAVLLWSLRLIELPWPDGLIDPGPMCEQVRDLGSAEAVAAKGLRPVSEILDAADLYYRLHWAVRDNGLRGLPEPAGLQGEVVWERDRGFRWLVCDYNRDWDDVDTST